jgi:hypothetical protein
MTIPEKGQYFDIGTPDNVVLRNARALYGSITYIAFGEVPLSYRIEDPGNNNIASEQFFFGKVCHAFNMPQRGLGGGCKRHLIHDE